MARSASAQKIVPLDLLGRQRQLRAAVKVTAKIAETFAKGTRRALPFLVRQRAKITAGEVVVGAASQVRKFSGPSYQLRLESEDGSAWAIIVLGPLAIMMILEGSLGGTSTQEVDNGNASADLTIAQRALLKGISEKLGEQLSLAIRAETAIVLAPVIGKALRTGDSIELADDALRVEIEFAEIAAPSTIELYLGAEALEAATRERDDADQASADPRMIEALRDVDLAVSVELGRITLGLGQVLSLRPGETLRLATALDDPVSIRVQGITKFTGTPVISRGQVSVQIQGRHSE